MGKENPPSSLFALNGGGAGTIHFRAQIGHFTTISPRFLSYFQ